VEQLSAFVKGNSSPQDIDDLLAPLLMAIDCFASHYSHRLIVIWSNAYSDGAVESYLRAHGAASQWNRAQPLQRFEITAGARERLETAISREQLDSVVSGSWVSLPIAPEGLCRW
jgi:hypothetical protein